MFKRWLGILWSSVGHGHLVGVRWCSWPITLVWILSKTMMQNVLQRAPVCSCFSHRLLYLLSYQVEEVCESGLEHFQGGASLTVDGRLFQRLGPATEKAWSPFCLRLAVVALRNLWPEDLSIRVLSGGDKSSAI